MKQLRSLTLVAAVMLTGCSSQADEPTLILGDDKVAVTYREFDLQNATGHIDRLIRTAGQKCDRVVRAADVRIDSIVDRPGTILEHPMPATHMKVKCANGRTYQVATYEPERRTVVQPWSRDLIRF